MKSTLVLAALIATVAAENKGAVCASSADCQATNAFSCCALWQDNDAAKTVRKTCQSAPSADASVLQISDGSLSGGSPGGGVHVSYMCMADKKCETDNSVSECQALSIKLPCCGSGNVGAAEVSNVCFAPSNVAAYTALESTFVFKCNNAV